jgi:hypothetical protein
MTEAEGALARALEAYRRAYPHREEEIDAAFNGLTEPPEPPPPPPEPEVLPLFDLGKANAIADEGMGKAMKADRVQDWKVRASAWLDALPSGTEFHFDMLTAWVGLPDEGANRNNVAGAWLNAQAKTGRIHFTGRWHKSERVARRGGMHRVWRKL